MTHSSKGYLIAAIGILFWSTTGIFIGALTRDHNLPALLLALWRDGLVFAALLVVLLIFKRGTLRVAWRDLPFFLFFGFILSIFNSIWTVSVSLNGAAVATVLAYGSAGFTVLLAWPIFGEKPGWAKAAAVALSLSGCVLVANALDAGVWQVNPLGIASGLLSGLAFSAYSLMGKQAARRGFDPWLVMLLSFGCAALFLFAYNLLGGTQPAGLMPVLNRSGWSLLVVLAVIPTVLGYGLYNTAMNFLPAGNVNLLATSEPLLTAILAYFILGEQLGAQQIFGGILIVLAVVMVRLGEKDPETEMI